MLLKEFAKKYKCIFYDFDGVMTDNKVILSEEGKESVLCNRSDGLAISKFRELNIRQIIVSTETNQVVLRRADKLKIECNHSIDNKENYVIAYIQSNNINPNTCVYFGNDINDLDAMKLCGLKVCPSDAYGEIKAISDIITKARGGEGVIREFYNKIKKL